VSNSLRVNRPTPRFRSLLRRRHASRQLQPGCRILCLATANTPGQAVNQDHDNDGVDNGIEYFMGQSGSGFTTLPVAVSNVVTWIMGGSYSGTYGTDYLVQTSPDLTT
jgi:hypothetical protein